MKRKFLLDTNICIFCMRGMYEMNRKIVFDLKVQSGRAERSINQFDGFK